ncbi:MAG: hypothetical protein U0792_11650 [Gemmataceae bacterium]
MSRSKARAQVWLRQNNGGWFQGANGTTDKNGIYKIAIAERRNHLVIVTHKDLILASRDLWSGGGRGQPHAHESIVFFTDRSLYRPGQTISFKGILTRIDQGREQLRDRHEPEGHRRVPRCEPQGSREGRDHEQRLRLDLGQFHRPA